MVCSTYPPKPPFFLEAAAAAAEDEAAVVPAPLLPTGGVPLVPPAESKTMTTYFENYDEFAVNG